MEGMRAKVRRTCRAISLMYGVGSPQSSSGPMCLKSSPADQDRDNYGALQGLCTSSTWACV